jgi:hypothetical protein
MRLDAIPDKLCRWRVYYFTPGEMCGSRRARAAITLPNCPTVQWNYGEWAGWVITREGKNFTYTVPDTFGDPENAHIWNILVPEGYTPVAAYHTHSGGRENEGLSDEPKGDTGWADKWLFDLYVVNTGSRNVYEYVPGATKKNGLTE